MPIFSGATQQSLATLLDLAATHSVIEGLYLRFEVDPLLSATNPNKLRKATHLVRELAKRSGSNNLSALITYVGSRNSGLSEVFRRGHPESRDFWKHVDLDLSQAKGSDRGATLTSRDSSGRRSTSTFQRPGTTAPAQSAPQRQSKRYVFVVRGRDEGVYEALALFLTALDLRIVTWNDAIRGAEGGTPHTLDIVRAGIDMADAVVVLLTPDDLGQAKPEHYRQHDDPREGTLSGQARQNVIFESGWAMALNQKSVVLVRVGDVRPLSDIDGLNYVRLTNDVSSRRSLITRLRNCKLEVDDSGEKWREAGTFPSD